MTRTGQKRDKLGGGSRKAKSSVGKSEQAQDLTLTQDKRIRRFLTADKRGSPCPAAYLKSPIIKVFLMTGCGR